MKEKNGRRKSGPEGSTPHEKNRRANWGVVLAPAGGSWLPNNYLVPGYQITIEREREYNNPIPNTLPPAECMIRRNVS